MNVSDILWKNDAQSVIIVSLTTQDIYRDQTVITITKLEIWK